jgi:hypothetical protein
MVRELRFLGLSRSEWPEELQLMVRELPSSARNGITPDPERVDEIRVWPTPRTARDVFLGLWVYLCKQGSLRVPP